MAGKKKYIYIYVNIYVYICICGWKTVDGQNIAPVEMVNIIPLAVVFELSFVAALPIKVVGLKDHLNGSFIHIIFFAQQQTLEMIQLDIAHLQHWWFHHHPSHPYQTPADKALELSPAQQLLCVGKLGNGRKETANHPEMKEHHWPNLHIFTVPYFVFLEEYDSKYRGDMFRTSDFMSIFHI